MQFLNFEADVQTCNTKQMVQLVMVRLEQNMLGGDKTKTKKTTQTFRPALTCGGDLGGPGGDMPEGPSTMGG